MTVATDEYQLALVLYELATGQRAHGDTSRSPLQHQRAVLESDPERPSRVVARRTSAPMPAAALEGDLDAIVLKALERDPEHRYPSVEAFRRDLENMLADLPVAARRATVGYRVRKYLRRHRLSVGAAALVLVSLVGGLAGVLVQARIAAHERDLARASERRATAINDFILRELLQAPTPERSLGRPLTVVEVLGNASRAIGHAFREEPEIGAGVRMTLARSYQALGLADSAGAHARSAIEILEQRLPADAPARLDARALVADLDLDRGRFAEGQLAFERLAADQARVLGPSAPATIRSQAQIARALAEQRHLVAADSILQYALAVLPDANGGNWRLAAEMRTWLASVRVSQWRPREAVVLLREAIDLERRQLGPEHPLIIATMRKLADALESDLHGAEASTVLEEVVRLSTRVNGEQHPATADAYMSLARNLDNQMRHEDALRANARAVEIDRQALGSQHPKTLQALRNQAVLLRGLRRYREAGPVYQEVYETCSRTLGPDHPRTIEALKGLVYLRLDEGRVAEARGLAHRILASYERLAAGRDPDPTTLADHALYLIEAVPADVRDVSRAVVLARRAVELTRHEDFHALRALGFASAAAGDTGLAITSLSAALALPEGIRSWSTEERLVGLMSLHATSAELEALLLGRVQQVRRVRGEDDRYAAKTLRHLSRLCLRTQRDRDAERYAREALAQLLKTLPAGHWEVGRAKSELGALLSARGATPEADSLLVQGYRALEGDSEISSAELELARARIVKHYTVARQPGLANTWRDLVIPRRAGD